MAVTYIDWRNMSEYTNIPMQYWLVDRIELDPERGGVGYKAVSSQDWYFRNHFPGFPAMPGVLLMEAMKRLGIFVVAAATGKEYEFYESRSFRLNKSVRPGNMCKIIVRILSFKNDAVIFSGEVKVLHGADETTAESICSMEYTLVPPGERELKRPAENKLVGTDPEQKDIDQHVYLDWKNLKYYVAGLKEFLFVDAVDTIPGKEAWGTKLLSSQDWYFALSDPEEPSMTDMLFLEIVAQAGAYAVTTLPQVKNNLILFYGSESFRVYGKAHPGDILKAHVVLRYYKRGLAKFEGALYCHRYGEKERLISEVLVTSVQPNDLAKATPSR